MKKKVIIIGAGPAGLTAAYKLLEENSKNYDVEILEETNEIGGISKTVNHNGNRMDIGGHRFFSKNEDIMNLWKEILNVQGKNSIDDIILKRKKKIQKGGPDPEKKDKVMLVRQRVSRIYYKKKFFDYPITLNKDTIKKIGIFKTIIVGFSYLKACIFKRKEKSLEDFYINRFGKSLYKMFFEKYTEKLWGRHPREIDASWGAQRVKGISIIAILRDIINKKKNKKDKENTETSLIEEFWYPKLGPGQLWEEMLNIVIKKGAKIKKNCKVEKINIKYKKIDSIICDIKGKKEEIKGDIFISSMPIKDLVLNIKDNKKESSLIFYAKKLPYRDFITVGILLDKLKIKNQTEIKTLNNIIPDCWIYVQEPDIKMCRIQVFNNWSPYLVKDVKNKIWLGLEYTCNENDNLWNMNKEELINFAINELTDMNIINEEDVIDTHIEKVKKAYPAYFDTYENIEEIKEYLNEFKNLYCIGRNGQHRYNNMDHSMLTAIEAVNNIINDIDDKSNIWNVNIEQEYHEVKKEK